MIDWSHEGIVGNKNPRFGKLLELERMTAPLGKEFLRKPRRAAIFASHLREPRATLIQALQRHIEVIGFGPGFDRSIKGHLESNFTKLDTLENFAFNLCPENSMYPGYYTEKIPEAFVADCLPIAWTDSNVQIDFNPQAMINLAPMMATDFQDLGDTYLSPSFLQDFSEQPLLQRRPTLDSLKSFLRKVLDSTI